MNKQELIEALQMLARCRIDSAETIADFLMPEPEAPIKVTAPEKKKAK